MGYKTIFYVSKQGYLKCSHTPQHPKNEDRTKKTLCLLEPKEINLNALQKAIQKQHLVLFGCVITLFVFNNPQRQK